MDPTLESSKGSRTLVHTLDTYNRKQPDKVFCSIPVSTDLKAGLRDVTYRDISQAVDAFAWWLVSSYGQSTTYETLAYLGTNDLRYAIVFFASIKAGYKAFFVSPLNSPSQTKSLLQQVSCKTFFFAAELQDNIEQVLAEVPDLSIEVVEPLPYWIASYSKRFPYKKSFETAKWDPILLLQSFSSTGHPNAITLNNGYFASIDAIYPDVYSRDIGHSHLFNFPNGGSIFCPIPIFLLSGFLCTCVYPLFAFTASNVLGPPDIPSTPELVKTVLDTVHIKLLLANHSLVEAVAELRGGMQTLSNLETLTYIDGPLSKPCGDTLTSHGVRVCQSYSSIETGSVPLLTPRPEDSDYIEFHPALDIDMELMSELEGGICELVFRVPDAADRAATSSSIAWTMPGANKYRSGDLFAPHPARKGLWRLCARVDDIVVLEDGNKINACEVERLVMADIHVSSRVSGVSLVGSKRRKLGLLLEPKEDSIELASELVDTIWPGIAKANESLPGWAKLHKDMVQVVDAQALVRAENGAIIRKANEDKHAALIDNMYTIERTIWILPRNHIT